MNDSIVVIYTVAYNAELTIHRAIDSILHQDYGDWVYYIVDNGSSDKTGIIIQEYANADHRIYYRVNSENHVWEPGNTWVDIVSEHNAQDFFTWLDADDEYEPTYITSMMEFIIRNNLNIAACGSQFIDAETELPMDKRYAIPHDLVIYKDGFSKQFKTYLQFMWTYWGKIYSVQLLQNLSLHHVDVSYGWDTIFTMGAFSRAQRVGILGGTLHKYYISNKSVSYQYNKLRVVSDQICCDVGLGYLQMQNASIEENQDLIYGTYANAIRNTLVLLRNAQIDPMEKLHNIRKIFIHNHTKEIFHRKSISDAFLLELQYSVIKYVLSLKQSRKGDGLIFAVDILAQMRDLPEVLSIYDWSDSEAFAFLANLRLQCKNNNMIPSIDKQIGHILSKSVYLKSVKVPLAVFMQGVVDFIIKNDLSAAIEEVFKLAEEEIPDEYAEGFITLALNLSAVTNNSDAFLIFKKVWISYLLDCLRYEEAGVLLDEYEEILPDDEELAEMRKRLP